MAFSGLNVGYQLRRDPCPPLALGLLIGLLTGGVTLAFLLTWLAFNHPSGQFVSPFTTLRYWGFPPPWRFQVAFGVSAAAAFVAGLVTYWHAFAHAPLREPFQQVRPNDPRVYYDDDARQVLQARFMKDAGEDSAEGLYLAPHLVMPRSAELKGLMVSGAQGSGKSNILRALADQMIQRGDRVLQLCNKGDVARSFLPSEAILIGAHHAHSHALDLAADIIGPAAAMQFAADIVPLSNPPFWSDAARTVLADIIMSLIKEHGTRWDARMLLDRCLADNPTIREAIERIDLNASSLLGSTDNEENKTVDGILITMRAAVFAKIRPLAWAWQHVPRNRRFSVRRWLIQDRQPKTVIVQLSAEYAAVSSLVAGHVIKSLAVCMADPLLGIDRNRRVGLILDEFHALDRIDGLPRALAVGREMGLVCMVGVQSPIQITKVYGPDEGKILTDLLQIKIYGRQVGGETTEAISNTFGTREVSALVVNRTPAAGDKRRLVEVRTTIPTFTPSSLANELGEQPTGRFRAIAHVYNQVHVLEWPKTIWRARRRGMVPATWLSNIPRARQPAAPK